MYKQTNMQSNYIGRPLNKNNSESMLRVCLFLFSVMKTDSRALCLLGKCSIPDFTFSSFFWSYMSFLPGTFSLLLSQAL